MDQVTHATPPIRCSCPACTADVLCVPGDVRELGRKVVITPGEIARRAAQILVRTNPDGLVDVFGPAH